MNALCLSPNVHVGFALAVLSCGGAPEAASPSADARPPSAQGAAAPPADAEAATEPGRDRPLFAIGDLHADLDQAVAALRLTGLVDADGHWVGGHAVLVQTGDVVDRGPDSREVVELLARLAGEARRSGGDLVALMGNHEVMNLQGDWRYVSPEDVADFGGPEARRAALAPDAELGRLLRGRDVAALVGTTVAVHGGVNRRWAAEGVDAINRQAREAIASGLWSAPVLGDAGPLWYRDIMLAPEAAACPDVEAALRALGARRMVVGHTTQEDGRIAARCEGRLIGLDTGIARTYGGHLAALRVEGDDAWALYPDGPADLPDPP